jgi:hypothetical protein
VACYVDGMTKTRKTRQWPYEQACHLVCDTTRQLDDMASCMELRPAWKQKPNTDHEHYDLTENMRRRAIECGATAIDWREMARVFQRKAAPWPR